MTKGKLAELLSALDLREMREVRRWLASPSHNERKDVRDFFEILYECKAGRRIEPGAKDLSTTIYPDQKHSRERLAHLKSFLSKALEEYFIQKELEKDKNIQAQLLQRAFKARSLEKSRLHLLRKEQKRQNQLPFRNAQWLMRQFELQQEAYNLSPLRSQTNLEALENTVRSLDHFYILSNLAWGSNVLSFKGIFDFEFRSALSEEVQRKAASIPEEEQPGIAVYLTLYKSLAQPDEGDPFSGFLERLQKYQQVFTREELKSIYLMGINYCIRQINRGRKGFLQKILLLYQEGLNSEALLEQGRLSPFTYKNIVAAALKLNESVWTETFIHDYRSKIDSPEGEGYFHFCLARLKHQQGKYREALRALIQSETVDLFTRLDAKVLQIKIYLQLEDFDFVEHLLDSFRQFLGRKEVLTYHKKLYGSFIRFTRAMLRLRHGDQKKGQELLKKIQGSPAFPERNWIQGQITRKLDL